MPNEKIDVRKKFNVKTETHVSWMFSAFGFLAFLALGFSIFAGSPAATIPFLIVGIIIFTIYKGVTIYPEAKYYIRYSSILGVRISKKTAYENIDYAFITRYNEVKSSNRYRFHSSTSFDEYIGWIRFSENHKLPLLVRDSKAEIETELKSLAAYLKTKVVDYSTK